MLKLRFFFLIFIFGIQSNAQNGAWLVGTIKNCRNGNYVSEQNSVKIFDGNKEVNYINEGFGAFYAKNIEAKSYIVQYENIFGQSVRKNVNLEEGNNYIDFCLDYFVEPNITTFLSSVNKLDTLKVSFKEITAINTNTKNAVFYYKGNSLWTYFSNGKRIISRKIKPEILKKLIVSEKKALEAAAIKDDTSDYRNIYTFKLRNKKKEAINCYIEDWHFYTDFFITIFGEKKYLKY